MRFHTNHLLVFVTAAAFAFALIRHPEALWAAVVPLIGGLFVVLPILGTVEFLAGRNSATPDVTWLSCCLIAIIAIVGTLLALACLFTLLDLAH